MLNRLKTNPRYEDTFPKQMDFTVNEDKVDVHSGK